MFNGHEIDYTFGLYYVDDDVSFKTLEEAAKYAFKDSIKDDKNIKLGVDTVCNDTQEIHSLSKAIANKYGVKVYKINDLGNTYEVVYEGQTDNLMKLLRGREYGMSASDAK